MMNMVLRTISSKFFSLAMLVILINFQLEAVEKDHQPNICMIIIDDCRPLLGCYGDPIAQTPNIDELAQSGTQFTKAYVQYPICGPSRASFMSGIRPGTSGFMTNQASFKKAFAGVTTINRHFMDHGYQVYGAGKVYHNGHGILEDWSEPFFETPWLDHVLPHNKAIADVFFTEQRRGLPTSVEMADVDDDDYCEGKARIASQEFIKKGAQSKKPFMMITGFRKPHLPYTAPKKYWDLYQRKDLPLAQNDHFPVNAPEAAIKKYGELWDYSDTPNPGSPLNEAQKRRSLHGYYACISYVDAQIGHIIATLKEQNVYDNTVIVLLGDNGYQNGNNGVWAKGVHWESTNHIPMLMRVPELGAPQQKSDALVEALDIFPTLCDIAGLDAPKHCEGQSLLPLIKDPEQPWHDVACGQFINGDAMGRSIRTARYRYTVWSEGDRDVGLELYDLIKDPQGNVNQAKNPEYSIALKKCRELYTKNWPKESM
jgi:iduronate 2-sulfatase